MFAFSYPESAWSDLSHRRRGNPEPELLQEVMAQILKRKPMCGHHTIEDMSQHTRSIALCLSTTCDAHPQPIIHSVNLNPCVPLFWRTAPTPPLLFFFFFHITPPLLFNLAKCHPYYIFLYNNQVPLNRRQIQAINKSIIHLGWCM